MSLLQVWVFIILLTILGYVLCILFYLDYQFYIKFVSKFLIFIYVISPIFLSFVCLVITSSPIVIPFHDFFFSISGIIYILYITFFLLLKYFVYMFWFYFYVCFFDRFGWHFVLLYVFSYFLLLYGDLICVYIELYSKFILYLIYGFWTYKQESLFKFFILVFLIFIYFLIYKWLTKKERKNISIFDCYVALLASFRLFFSSTDLRVKQRYHSSSFFIPVVRELFLSFTNWFWINNIVGKIFILYYRTLIITFICFFIWCLIDIGDVETISLYFCFVWQFFIGVYLSVLSYLTFIFPVMYCGRLVYLFFRPEDARYFFEPFTVILGTKSKHQYKTDRKKLMRRYKPFLLFIFSLIVFIFFFFFSLFLFYQDLYFGI